MAVRQRRQPDAVRGGQLRGRAERSRRAAAPPAEPAQLTGRRLGRLGVQVDVHLDPEGVQDAAVVEGALAGHRRVERTEPTLPVQVAAGLLHCGCDREHDVGQRGHRGVPQFQADHEAGGGDRLPGGGRVGQVVERDAADQQAAERAVLRGRQDLGGGPARFGRHRRTPELLDLRPGGGVGDRTASGQQRPDGAGVDGSPVAGPARHPGHPGAAALHQFRHRGQQSGHVRGALPHEHHDPVAGEPVGQRIAGVEQTADDPRLVTGGGRHQGAADLAQPTGGDRGDGEHRRPRAAERLAQPQEQDRRLLLGLQPDEQHGGGVLDVAVGHSAAVGSDRGDVVRQEGVLLGAAGPGAEVDVVGAQREPGELGVGVGVGHGQSAAGEHPDAPVVARLRPVRRRRRPSPTVHDASTSTPCSSRTSGRVSRSGAVT